MDHRRHALLYTLPFRTRAALFDAAAGAKVGVADVVAAGIGRRAVPAAIEASRAVDTKFPGVFDGLVKTWPYDCAYCGAVVDEVRLCALGCGQAGCIACIRDGCPTCDGVRRSAAAERRERARVAAEGL